MLDRRSVLTSALAAAGALSLPKSVFATEQAALKLYDTHAHFYSNDATHYPFRTDIAPAALSKAQAHPMTDEVILKLWDGDRVAMGCGVQYNTTYATDNRYLLDVSAKHPRRIMPVVILDPIRNDTPAALARMARENHITGVRFAGPPNDAGVFTFLSDDALASWEAANDLGLVVVLMPYRGDLPAAMRRVGELAARHPRINIVLDHIGFPTPEISPSFGLSPSHLALKSHGNIHYKYTSLLIEQLRAAKVPTQDFLRFVVGHYGADHMVWGSDVGNTEGEFDHLVHLALASAQGLPMAQQQALFFDTANRLFVPGGRPRA